MDNLDLSNESVMNVYLFRRQAYLGSHLVADRAISNRKKQIPTAKADVGLAASCSARMQSWQLDNRLEQWNLIVSSARLL